jgi:hypothetical protein
VLLVIETILAIQVVWVALRLAICIIIKHFRRECNNRSRDGPSGAVNKNSRVSTLQGERELGICCDFSANLHALLDLLLFLEILFSTSAISL